MDRVKAFLSEKSIGFYVSFATLILALISLIIYTARGGNAYSPVSTGAVVLMIFGILTNIVILFKDFKIGGFIPYILYLSAFGVLFANEMLFITNVLTAIDGNTFDGAYIAFWIFFFITLATSMASAIMKITKAKK